MKRYVRIIFVLAVFSAISLSGPPAHGVVIFSNFGEGDSYDSSGGLLISSEDSMLLGVPLGKSTVGFAFTTPEGAPLSYDTVALAVALEQGENVLDVSLLGDFENTPGAPIETFHIIDRMIPDPSGSIVFARSLLHPVLNPTTQYWLLASTSGANTIVRWFFNDIGDTGSTATRFGEAELEISNSTRGAFKIIPEPHSLLLLVLGFLVFVCITKNHTKIFTSSPQGR